jgi:hypothetical protein
VASPAPVIADRAIGIEKGHWTDQKSEESVAVGQFTVRDNLNRQTVSDRSTPGVAHMWSSRHHSPLEKIGHASVPTM